MVDIFKIENSIRDILIAIGENPDRQGLIETPNRVANMFAEVFSGINQDAIKGVKVFREERCNSPVIVKDIYFSSMCEHHLLPFLGHVSVAYIPDNNKIIGLSKIIRIVNIISKRPQLQERLTNEIADAVFCATKSKGVIVSVKAEHLCMSMRGVKNPGANTITLAFNGIFENNINLRNEFINLL